MTTVPALSRARHSACRLEQLWRPRPTTTVIRPARTTRTAPTLARLPGSARNRVAPAASNVMAMAMKPRIITGAAPDSWRSQGADGLTEAAVPRIEEAGERNGGRGGGRGPGRNVGEQPTRGRPAAACVGGGRGFGGGGGGGRADDHGDLLDWNVVPEVGGSWPILVERPCSPAAVALHARFQVLAALSAQAQPYDQRTLLHPCGAHPRTPGWPLPALARSPAPV